MFKKILLLILVIPFQWVYAQQDMLDKFPKGYTAQEVGKRIANRFLTAKHALHAGKWIGYPETFYFNGTLKYASLTKDQDFIQKLQQRFDLLFSTEKHLLPIMNHVDLNMFGSLPLNLYQVTKETKYLELGLPYADTQWELPENANAEQKNWSSKGYSWQTRLWIDDMYMITIVQTQAFRVTQNSKYIDRAAKEMVLYLDELQRDNGLFYHATDVPFYWGRGNGWMAAGISELLGCMPENHKDRPRILKGYRLMMKNFKKYQTPNGMWNQLIDDPECWPETSGSAMIAYAMITGVKKGWLNNKEYAPVARKAWMALVPYVNEQGAVSQVCVGTNKKNDKQYYYDRPRATGDYHGQAAVSWCIGALLE